MEPTIIHLLLFYFYLFNICFWYLVSIQFLFLFRSEMPRKNIVVGKVGVAKAIGIFILYIGKIRFVINKLGHGEEITERKEINKLFIKVSFIQ